MPSSHEIDLHAGFRPVGGNGDVSVFSRNLLNDRHITEIAPYNGFPMATPNEPRVVGITQKGRV